MEEGFNALLHSLLNTFVTRHPSYNPPMNVYHMTISCLSIPLQPKTTLIGFSLIRDFHVADTSMLVSKNPCRPNASAMVPNTSASVPSTTPNASWWSMVCVGYVRVWFALAMYISCCLCQFRFVLGTQRECSFLWNMGFTCKVWSSLKINVIACYNAYYFYHRCLNNQVWSGPLAGPFLLPYFSSSRAGVLNLVLSTG